MQTKLESNDYLDFCGNHQPDFSLMDEQKLQDLLDGIQNDCSFSELAALFEEELDQLAYCAVFAFSIAKLTRNQTAIFLEYRSMKMDFLDLKIIDIHQYDSEILPYSPVLGGKDKWQKRFQNFIEQMPRFEACVFSFTVPKKHLEDENLKGFLQMAHAEKVIKMKGSIQISLPSLSVRDALTKAHYYEHAKKSFPRLGVFTIDDIEHSTENGGRYFSLDFPSIPTSKSFHKIKAAPTYITLHDELHRRLLSTIPNPIFRSFLNAISLVREKTGLTWSKEIWTALDLEVGDFITHYIDYENYENNTIALNTHYFKILLDAKVYSKDTITGLFSASPSIDTTWLILLDMVLEPEKWLKQKIDIQTLGADNTYLLLYKFIIKNKERISAMQNCSDQIAFLKSTWFDITYDKTQEAQWVKDQDRHLQVIVNGVPLVKGKSEVCQLQNQMWKYRSIQDKSILNVHFDLNYFVYEPTFVNTFGLKFATSLSTKESQFYQDTIYKALIKFRCSSIPQLREILRFLTKKDQKLFFSMLLKENEYLRQMKWTLLDLHKLFELDPEFKETFLDIIFLGNPQKQLLIYSLENTNYQLLEAVEILYNKNVLNEKILSILKNNQYSAQILADMILELNEANLFTDELCEILLKHPNKASSILKGLCTLHEENVFTVENRDFLFQNTRQAFVIAKILCLLQKANLFNDTFKKLLSEINIILSPLKDCISILNDNNLLNETNALFLFSHADEANSIYDIFNLLDSKKNLTMENLSFIFKRVDKVETILDIIKSIQEKNLIDFFFKQTQSSPVLLEYAYILYSEDLLNYHIETLLENPENAQALMEDILASNYIIANGKYTFFNNSQSVNQDIAYSAEMKLV